MPVGSYKESCYEHWGGHAFSFFLGICLGVGLLGHVVAGEKFEELTPHIYFLGSV